MFIKRSTEELGVKGAVGGRSKITSEEGRVTWVELFPFPEVTAKYGHAARNRYFPALCRDCAISHLGRGALETYCISSLREREREREELFSPLANCCQRVGSKSPILHCGSQHEADHVSIWHYRFLRRVHGSTEEEEGSERKKSVRRRRWVGTRRGIYGI